jgi:putative heme-binding domain-containing protein
VIPNIFGFIDQHADHYHYDTGAGWTHSRAAEDGSSFAKTSDALGGGHAHSGLMIYQGDNWPPQYRGKLYTANLHGRRINSDRLERQGSGYVGRHERDFLSVGDAWFRGIDLLQGPDGGVFIADWSDWGECHDSDGVHRNSGRIYKVTYGDPPKPAGPELTQQSDKTLVALLFGTNQWVVQQARRVLGDRGLDTGKRPLLSEEILRAFTNHQETTQKLHALWALVAMDAAPCNWLLEQTHDPDEHIRSWAVRLVTDAMAAEIESHSRNPVNPAPPETLPLVASATRRFTELARSDPSALVRLYLASALQKIPLNSRRELALALLRHDEDVGDHNMGLMLWFGIEPLVGAKPLGGAELAIESRHGIVRQYVARRLAADVERNPAGLERLLAVIGNSKDGFAAQTQDILNGMTEALRGWRKASPPENWQIFAARALTNSEVSIKNQVRELSILFGDPEMLAGIRQTLADTQASTIARKNALRILLGRRTDDLAALLKQVAKEDDVGIEATLGLLQLGDRDAPGLALSHYDLGSQSNRTQILAAMVTRPIAANVLLNAVAEGRISRADVTPFHARQIASLNDVVLTKRLGEVWGSVRISDAEKRAAMDRFRSELSTTRLQSANLSNGRRVFNQACASCHKLYGEGGTVGPDLTGSGRTQLDYLLENVVDPSAVMSVEYRLSIVRSKDGEVFNGLVREKTDRTVTLQSQTGLISIEASDIVSMEESPLSLMPEGMLESFGTDDRRDLIGYLMHPQQVPLPR